MAEHNYKFNVTMTCGGCSGAVERVLKKLDGKYFPPSPSLPSLSSSSHPLSTPSISYPQNSSPSLSFHPIKESLAQD
jgi:copper chaperone CopZ